MVIESFFDVDKTLSFLPPMTGNGWNPGYSQMLIWGIAYGLVLPTLFGFY